MHIETRIISDIKPAQTDSDPICSKAFPWWAVALAWAASAHTDENFPLREIHSRKDRNLSILAMKKQLAGVDIGVANHLIVGVSGHKYARLLGQVACYQSAAFGAKQYCHRGPEYRDLPSLVRCELQDIVNHEPNQALTYFLKMTSDHGHLQIPGTINDLFERYALQSASLSLSLGSFRCDHPDAVFLILR